MMFTLKRASVLFGSRVVGSKLFGAGLCGQLLPKNVLKCSMSTQSIVKRGLVPENFDSHDGAFEKDRVPPGSNQKEYTYFILGGARFIYASFARLLLIQFVSSMSIPADAAAMAFTEVDLSSLPVGNTLTIVWRGKPVFIRRRSAEEIEAEQAVPMHALRDEETDDERVINPEFIVVLGICTHLGCVPLCNAGDYQGWLCPCHGSHYDLSGRIRKGPAPLNMDIPAYKFIEDKTILIG